MKPIPVHEMEYRQGLLRLERAAIIPLKWTVLAVTLVLSIWVIKTEFALPVFMLFLVYFLLNCATTYFFYVSGVTLRQVRPLTLVFYLSDVVFVSMLVYFDLATNYFAQTPHHDLYMLYFLLVMRGFAMFKTIAETIFVNMLVSGLYVLIFYISDVRMDENFVVSLIIIWLVILMSWFIVTIITKQKMELMEVNDRLLRTDNLARVGELAAGVAHEINNPIGIISATAEYLERRTPEGGELREELKQIHREAMRCKEIVQEMLTYANPRPIGMTPIEPISINDEVLNFVFPKQRSERFEVIREYDDKPPLFRADPNLVKQVLLNLYLNAKQAIPENGKGRIVSRIRSERKGELVRFEVEDNGVGIPEEDMPNIFDPFFTRKEKGTGLGLAVTQRIVENCEGSITVRPAPNKGPGTIFSIDFHRAVEQ